MKELLERTSYERKCSIAHLYTRQQQNREDILFSLSYNYLLLFSYTSHAPLMRIASPIFSFFILYSTRTLLNANGTYDSLARNGPPDSKTVLSGSTHTNDRPHAQQRSVRALLGARLIDS